MTCHSSSVFSELFVLIELAHTVCIYLLYDACVGVLKWFLLGTGLEAIDIPGPTEVFALVGHRMFSKALDHSTVYSRRFLAVYVVTPLA